MKKVTLLLITTALVSSCSSKIIRQSSDFELYKSYIQGDLDNLEQINEEIKAGKQIHPYAKHVNRLFDSKIKNLPANYNGFYILEESYYTYPNKAMEVKPYLFWFEKTEKGHIRLHSLQIPNNLDKKNLKNDNKKLFINYSDLVDSPTFKPTIYTRTKKGFYIKSSIELPNEMKFTLEETIGKDSFEVMELLEKNGKSVTPYTTPIIYKRIKM
jgi:hypothetical protein